MNLINNTVEATWCSGYWTFIVQTFDQRMEGHGRGGGMVCRVCWSLLTALLFPL